MSEVIGCTEQGMEAAKPLRNAKLGRASVICFSILCASEGSHLEGTYSDGFLAQHISLES